MNKTAIFAFFALSSLIISSCKQSTTPSSNTTQGTTYFGDAAVVGTDSIHSFIKTDASGNPSSIGVSFSQKVLTTLGPQSDMMFMLMLPMINGKQAAAPFDHIELDWSKTGDPTPPYNVGQMGLHCFTVDTMTQMMVMAGMDNMTMNMDMKYIPSGYEMMMDAEAMMGVHCMDTTDHSNPFNHTVMYGFYHGDLYFMEAMVAKTFLDSKTNYSADIRQPQAFKKSGWYPTRYNVAFDGTNYSISLDNFVQH